MKTFIKLGPLVVLVFLLSGCGVLTSDWLVSPGRVDHYQLQAEVNKLDKFWRELPNPANTRPDKLEIIGHGAGSYRHYPMDINIDDYPEGNKSKAKNVSHLMDAVINTGFVDSIELDSQLPLVSQVPHELCRDNDGAKLPCSFVMHNTPDWMLISEKDTPKTFTYMQKNTVSSVLEHFIDRGYHRKGKLVYLELKCDDDKSNIINCAEAGIQVAQDIKDIIRNTKQSKGSKNWLTITSFFPVALNAFRDELESGLNDKVDYALIAGYDKAGFLGIKAWAAQLKGRVPEFDTDIQKFATSKPWLDRIWFSTKGITDPASVFEKVKEAREKNCPGYNKGLCKDLEFSVSSYDNSWKQFKKTLNGNSPFSLPLVSIMIDIDD